jgi:plasmid stabilization system protein ParE
MALEIVWTAGAERDLVELHQQVLHWLGDDAELVDRVLEQPLESSLRLLRDHPEIAPKVRGTRRARRRLLGPHQRYGLFYVVEQRAIFIHALLDLRQDPQTIWKRLREI